MKKYSYNLLWLALRLTILASFWINSVAIAQSPQSVNTEIQLFVNNAEGYDEFGNIEKYHVYFSIESVGQAFDFVPFSNCIFNEIDPYLSNITTLGNINIQKNEGFNIGNDGNYNHTLNTTPYFFHA